MTKFQSVACRLLPAHEQLVASLQRHKEIENVTSQLEQVETEDH